MTRVNRRSDRRYSTRGPSEWPWRSPFPREGYRIISGYRMEGVRCSPVDTRCAGELLRAVPELTRAMSIPGQHEGREVPLGRRLLPPAGSEARRGRRRMRNVRGRGRGCLGRIVRADGADLKDRRLGRAAPARDLAAGHIRGCLPKAGRTASAQGGEGGRTQDG